MTSSSTTAKRVGEILEPLASTMHADGYELHVDSADAGLRLRIEAQPHACSDCLVSKPVFLAMVRQMLGKELPQSVSLDVIYPNEANVPEARD